MSEHSDLPYKAEYAKSGRASCKLCSMAINKDSLRIAIMIQSPMFDGKIPNWYHFKCVWKRAKIKTHTDIHGFDALRWEDQKQIKEKIESGEGASAPVGKTDFNTEYAKSGRSTCRGCEEKIAKDNIRISKKDFESQRAKMYGPQDLWYHVDCFVEKRDDIGFGAEMDPSTINGFKNLKKEDREEIITKLGKGEKKKRKNEDDEAAKKKQKTKETPEEKALRKQSQLIWNYRDKLSKEVSNAAMKLLLEYNGMDVPGGESKLLDAVSDCLAFGALLPCPECNSPSIVYSGSCYKCTGNVTEWTKCLYTTKQPKRKAFKIPKEFHDVAFLKSYKYEPRDRVFPKESVDEADGPVSSADGSNSGPLNGMKFVITVKTETPKEDLERRIKRLGGKVVGHVDKKTAAVISTKEQVEKKTKYIIEAEKHDIHVVSEAFVKAVKKGGAALLITAHSIASWGSDPHERIESEDAVNGASASKSGGKSMQKLVSDRDEKMFTKSVPTKMKMTVKGGAAVDPDSNLESKAHVYQEKGDLHTAVLGLVDIVRGTNSYYKLQLLEGDTQNRYWVFRSWGRVGTTIGGNKLETLGSKANAIEHFKTMYLEKTGNEWEDRKNFVKYPNKFYPLDIDYGADDEEVKNLDLKTSNSKLPKPTQELIKMIFDVESMKKAMLEFEIDLKKMPLGKLSKKQIETAYKVLTELNKLIEDDGTPTQFLDASNRFYTLIPHDFGMKKPPLLDTAEIIKSKTDMLDNLLEIEIAYSLLKSGNEGGKDPIDVHYEQLKSDIKPMDKDSEEYKRLHQYVKNTHAATHNQYELELQEIFEMKRDGDRKRFKPFKQLPNRMLLWHGSRRTNYAGILSQGLRIAPPEAPVTGYMFGKGIYFADMVSKSANYCRTTKSDPVGLLILSEVALGNMYELTAADYITSLPKGKHSTKGVGMTAPDPKDNYTTKDGLIIPMGKGTASAGYSSLLYNEYIVYDVAQVDMKYLLQVNFKYKW